MIRHSSQLRSLPARFSFAMAALFIFLIGLKVAAEDVFSSFALASATAARPNLAPGNVNLSSYSVLPGGQIMIAWTTTNSGSGDCLGSFTGIYLSQSATSRPLNQQPLATFNTPDIRANSSVRQTNFITIPSNMPLGTYYVWVVADDTPDSPLNQTTKADDVTRSSALAVVTVIRQPNLVPQSITLSANAALRDDEIEVMWTLTNKGNVMCPLSLTGFHLGTSATVVPTNDVLNLRFETPEIGANSVMRFTNRFRIPTNTTLATNYFWVVADDDPNSTVNQSSRADDAARSPALSVVSVITKPNLVPLNVTLSSSQVRTGAQVTVIWTVTNSGNANCPTNITGLHLGTSPLNAPTNDILNRKIPAPAINTNSFVRQTNTITIPANTPPGDYYVWVLVDDVPNSALNQSSRADDAAHSTVLAVLSVLRQPNLVATNVVLSTQFALRGDRITAIWTLTNSGNANCPPSQTGLKLGTSATVRPTNSILNVLVPTPEIRTNAFLRQTNDVMIPTNAPLGTNYLWVIADDVANSTLDQSSRADDAAASRPLAIVTVLPRPNLVPLNITLSSYSARPGDEVRVTWTMTNSGNATCPPSVTGIRLGQSSTTSPTNNALKISLPTPAINANASLRQTNVVRLPTNTATGTYYLWVIADDVTDSTLDQSSRADDAASSAALAVASVTLISPAASATVDAPPAFEWNGVANGEIYLAAKSSTVLGIDKILFADNPPGTNKFKLTATNWVAAVRALGFAPSYFWTVGSADPARREIYAEWRPFKAIPVTISGTAVATANRQFQFQIAAPNQAQVTIEAADTLTNNWAAIATVQNVNGTVTYTDQTAATRTKRFFRVKP
jgi:hypothetical protein